MKIIIRNFNIKYIVIILLFISNSVISQQVCKTEVEILSSTPDNRFVDNLNGTVTDKATELVWQKCQMGLTGANCETGTTNTYTWNNALNEAQLNTTAGFNDWRLPNISELESLVEQRCNNPSINTNFFPNTSSDYFWTSSPTANLPNYSWHVTFQYGHSSGYAFRNLTKSVRLVR